MKDRIQALAASLHPEIVSVRRHLHAHPELSFEEYKTSEYICNKLTEWQIPFSSGYVKTGILGRIEGRKPSKRIIALRADMDALPIHESEHNCEYKSQNPGVMHACGHDVHSSSLLGAAKILQNIRDEFEGTILLVFQPGEEKLPGGAKLMMDEGVFAEYKPELIIGQHVMPQYEAGQAGFRPGMYMASTDEIYITVKGTGGHGALPHLLADPVLIASHLIVALQQIVSRNSAPEIPSVLSFGKFIANGATNVIPNEVQIEGTFRTMHETWRAEAHQRMTLLAKSLCQSMGADCEIEIRNGYPFLVNDPETTANARQSAAEYLGSESIIDMDLRMTGEDFAYFTQAYPATFYRLGVKRPGQAPFGGLHTPDFDIDEDALRHGMGLMAYIAWKAMQ